MHELSRIREVMRVLGESAKENNISNIQKVRLVVCSLNADLPAEVRSCFELLATEPPFVNTRLEIVQTAGTDSIVGNELYVDYYEGE